MNKAKLIFGTCTAVLGLLAINANTVHADAINWNGDAQNNTLNKQNYVKSNTTINNIKTTHVHSAVNISKPVDFTVEDQPINYQFVDLNGNKVANTETEAFDLPNSDQTINGQYGLPAGYQLKNKTNQYSVSRKSADNNRFVVTANMTPKGVVIDRNEVADVSQALSRAVNAQYRDYATDIMGYGDSSDMRSRFWHTYTQNTDNSDIVIHLQADDGVTDNRSDLNADKSSNPYTDWWAIKVDGNVPASAPLAVSGLHLFTNVAPTNAKGGLLSQRGFDDREHMMWGYSSDSDDFQKIHDFIIKYGTFGYENGNSEATKYPRYQLDVVLSNKDHNYHFIDSTGNSYLDPKQNNLVDVVVTKPIKVNDDALNKLSVKRTITLHFPNNQIPNSYKQFVTINNNKDQIVQTLNFSRDVVKDSLTGNILSESTWQGENKFPDVKLPKIPGFKLQIS